MSLFFKECKRVVCSLPYLLFVGVLLFFLNSQITDRPLLAPTPGQQNYGLKTVEEPTVIMPRAVQSLWEGYQENHFTTYPIGFVKTVKLSEQKRQEMATILSTLTGKPLSELPKGSVSSEIEVGGESLSGENGSYTVQQGPGEASSTVTVDPSLSYTDFLELMRKADKLLGGGSDYGDTYRTIRFGSVPLSYEEALAEYEATLRADGVTGAYARRFSDYAGIMLGLLPVFIATACWLKDRREGICAQLYCRRIGSARLVLTRFFAQVAAMLLPLMCFAGIDAARSIVSNPGLPSAPLLYLPYIFGWLLPTLLTATAVGTLLTILTDTPVAVLVQGLWWFIDIFSGMAGMGYDLQLMPRHNALGKTTYFTQHLGSLVANRLFYLVLALLLLSLSIYIYHQKRKGHFHGFQTFAADRRHRKNRALA